MNTLQTNRSTRAVAQTSILGFRGDVYRRAGDMRAVTLENRVVNTDSIFGLSRSVEGSFEESFGKTANDIEMDADREMDEFKGNLQSAFSKYDTSR